MSAFFSTKAISSVAPSVYVSTYHKYACGNLDGEWVCLQDFDSYDDFISRCLAIHADEADPELMFQDFEGFPEQWYSECSLDEDHFNDIIAFADLADVYGSDTVTEFVNLGIDSLDRFTDYYYGKYSSELDFAYEVAEEYFDFDKFGQLACYFDYEAFARDIFISDFHFCNGIVFRTCA